MFIDNYEISKNLIKAAYECKIYKLINISSSCKYPQNKKHKETDLLTENLNQLILDMQWQRHFQQNIVNL